MTARQKAILLWLLAAIIGVGIGMFLASESDATTRQTCWKVGAEIKCREETWGTPNRSATPRETTCWRNGAQWVCETR